MAGRVDLIIVGNHGGTNVGWSFAKSCAQLDMRASYADARLAFAGPSWARRLHWHVLGHRPSRLGSFSRRLLRTCQELRPRRLLTTGLAPVGDAALRSIAKLGIQLVNYLTDDPWNRACRAQW